MSNFRGEFSPWQASTGERNLSSFPCVRYSSPGIQCCLEVMSILLKYLFPTLFKAVTPGGEVKGTPSAWRNQTLRGRGFILISTFPPLRVRVKMLSLWLHYPPRAEFGALTVKPGTEGAKKVRGCVSSSHARGHLGDGRLLLVTKTFT